MLILIFFIVFSSFASKGTGDFNQCILNALISKEYTAFRAERARITSGESFLRKEFRNLLYDQSSNVNYPKHVIAKSKEMAKSISKEGDAQYLPNSLLPHKTYQQLENYALREMEGHWYTEVNKGKIVIYKLVKFEESIGYALGKETKWVRVEWSSRMIHGHPIDRDRLKKYCRDCVFD